jgi:proteic killer suppression protein
MINSFKHKGLAELFERGRSRKVSQDLQSRSLRRLDASDQAESLTDLNIPGFNFHGLQGKPKRYSIHVMVHGALPLNGKPVMHLR